MIDVKTIRFNSNASGETGLSGLVNDYIDKMIDDNWHTLGHFTKYDKEASKIQKLPVYVNVITMCKYIN